MVELEERGNFSKLDFQVSSKVQGPGWAVGLSHAFAAG